MAIIGELDSVREKISTGGLDYVFDYLSNANTEGSEIRSRIFSRPIGAFEKVNLTDDVFALEQVYYTKEREQCFIESHKKYIDFQLHLSGIEQMEMIDVFRLDIKHEYDESKDLLVYESSNEMSKIVMKEGMIAIFFPEDAHMGLPMFQNKSELIYKTVIKLPIEKFGL